MAAKQKNKKKEYVYAVGRRRSASARVRLFKGKGENTVNGKKVSDYFTGITEEVVWSKPLRAIDAMSDYYFTVKVSGGGKKGQLDAIAHGLAKALVTDSKGFKKALRDAGLLTRDARVRERRKVGTGGKARRKKQSPKR